MMRLTLIQLPVFAAKWSKLRLADEDLQSLEAMLIADPEVGNLIPGTGGLRKVRFAPPSRHAGKRGGFRVIYAFIEPGEAVYLFTLYGKTSGAICHTMKRRYFGRCSIACTASTNGDFGGTFIMPTRTRKASKPRVADEIMAGMRELQRMMNEGKTPEQMFTIRTIEVPEPGTFSPRQIRTLRESLGVSQAVFAHLLGVSVILVKSWERGIREPSPLARRLLDTIKADPPRWLATVRKMPSA